jgi:asparagine synthase (glutamine-hydrolysing)
MTEPALRSSGIYALLCRDGAPLAPADTRALGLDLPGDSASWIAAGHDSHDAAAAIHRDDGPHGSALLVGDVPEAADLAARLGLARSAPLAGIAAAALARFGADTPAQMLGEWSLLHRSPAGALTLMIGPAMRDRLHYAVTDSRIAVAPDLFRLAQINWIGRDLDEAGLLFRWGRARLRGGNGDRTMLANVKQLEAGGSVVITADGSVQRTRANVLTPQARWEGSFADALAESEALLRTIMAERLAADARPAVLLSGGLDSSLLAWAAAIEQRGGKSLFAITSAAPAKSRLVDETPFARQVAGHLGLECIAATAAHGADFFRPPASILAGASGPLLSNRHCLTEAFQIAAQAHGATRLINGTYGEMTASVRLPDQRLRALLRRHAAWAWHALRRRDMAQAGENPFHIRIAPQRLCSLPEPLTTALNQPSAALDSWPGPDGLFGYLPGAAKALAQPNEFYPGALRMDFPFRDLRLLRLFAGFPLVMLQQGGADRPVARAMLNGRLPDAIRLRRQGRPAEPDRYQRMQRQAPGALARIARFRGAGIGEWIDLDWLDQALRRVAAQGAADNHETNEVQLTAMAAEFLLWWFCEG